MDRSQPDWDPAELELMQHASVNLFWRPQLFEQAQRTLAGLSYSVSTIRCADGWESFKAQMSALLRWEEQFGYAPWTGHLDALNDGLYGYPFPPGGRAALALAGYHALVREDRRASEIVLDLLEARSRDFLVFAKRLIVLVQTDDNQFDCPALGARQPMWNRQEWFNCDRGM